MYEHVLLTSHCEQSGGRDRTTRINIASPRVHTCKATIDCNSWKKRHCASFVDESKEFLSDFLLLSAAATCICTVEEKKKEKKSTRSLRNQNIISQFSDIAFIPIPSVLSIFIKSVCKVTKKKEEKNPKAKLAITSTRPYKFNDTTVNTLYRRHRAVKQKP